MSEPKNFEEACLIVVEEIASLVISKQHDYGHRNILDFGEIGILVRVNDKVERLKNLKDKQPINETVDDNWGDLAGYSIIALMLRRGWFQLDLSGEI